jgi:hypothetical protein
MESFPCQHNGYLNGKEWRGNGDEIYTLLLENGYSDEHFNGYCYTN